ncbi:mitochondrial carrier homolog 2-like [Babylonia areolata]|uniref:mitochondrial carrier homolog 2-like n=1 Tax=Babylonia areolata TaxID=304850 RepID=UPI003FD25B96
MSECTLATECTFASTLCQVLIGNYSVVIKTLCQAGFELKPAYPLLGLDYYVFYPNPVRLLLTLLRDNDTMVLFRAVGERLAAEMLWKAADSKVAQELMKVEVLKERVPFYWQHAVKLTLSKMAATVLAHPLRVIAVRKVLQLAGGGTAYNNPLSAALEIYSQEGWVGFFSGLAPSLVHVGLTCGLMAVAERYSGPSSLVSIVKVKVSVWSILITYVTYPLSTVTTVMMAAGSKLPLASTTTYPSWLHCFWDLARQMRLFRGAYTA